VSVPSTDSHLVPDEPQAWTLRLANRLAWTVPSKSVAPNRERLLERIHRRTQQLRSAADTDLRAAADLLRTGLAPGPIEYPAMIEGLSLFTEAVRRTLNVELHDEQIWAGAGMLGNAVVEMQTGEGKTLACAAAACLSALSGRGVHVVTPNAYLADRDSQLARIPLAILGVGVGLLPEEPDIERKRDAYRLDICYGTAYEFGFDYLRDQLVLREQSRLPAGQRVWNLLGGRAGVDHEVVQRSLASAIVDEVDNVLLDDAVSPLVLSLASDQQARDVVVHQAARNVAALLRAGEDYQIDAWSQTVRLTSAGQQRIHHSDLHVPVESLVRTWSEYVEQALHAEQLMRRDVHYVVVDGRVRIVDAGTGRIFADRAWRNGLHQAVEAKEGVAITADRESLAQLTRQRFFRLYEHLAGATGTAAGCEAELRHTYGLQVVIVPPRRPCRRLIWPTRTFVNMSVKFQAIMQSVIELRAAGRPVLVGTRSIADSEYLAQSCREAGVVHQLLNGRQDRREAEIIAQAGLAGAVTIATNLAGRGTDIRLGPGVAEKGGLHVIVADCHESARITRQLIGRCARQGDPGSCQSFLSADDPVLRRYGHWFCEYVTRFAGPGGELIRDCSGPIGRIQRAAERADYAARAALMHRDHSRDSLFAATRERS